MPLPHRHDLGLLALRVGAGGVLFAHGAQKLFGWFGGSGLEATSGAMESMGFTPGRESAIAAGLGEAGGGALLALGLATPAAGAAAAGAMAGAAAVHAPKGFFAMGGGLEYPALLGYIAAGLGLTGPGRYSLDRATGDCLNRPWVVVAGFTASALAAGCVLRRRALATSASAAGTAPTESGATTRP
jgi:putative oxidoreductase